MKNNNRNKYDLQDVTFMIAIKCDSEERKENLELIIEYLLYHFTTNIMVLERSNKKVFSYLGDQVDYQYIYSDDENFHKTYCLNLMAKRATTNIIAIYDADVLLRVSQYIETANIIRSGTSAMAFPYAGPFLDCNRQQYYLKIKNSFSVDWIDPTKLICLNRLSPGGSMFWNKNKFFEFGMANENFRSWGYEDNELALRAHILGGNVMRANGVLYHLSHPRLTDSWFHNKYCSNNETEFNKIQNMSRDELKDYVATWKWLKK